MCYLADSGGARVLALGYGASPEPEVVGEQVFPGPVSSELDTIATGLLHGWHIGALPFQEAEITKVLEEEARWQLKLFIEHVGLMGHVGFGDS